MIRNSLFSIFAIGLLLAGCFSIPERHGTAGHYNESGAYNTECFADDTTLRPNISRSPQQINALNSQGFSVLNWNSYKGRNTLWKEDLERLISHSDVVVLQEGYLTDGLQLLLSKNQYNWDIAKAFTFNDVYTGVLTASRVKPDFLCSFRMPEPLSGIPKTVLITRYPLSGTDEYLVVANIHMINFSLGLADYQAQLKKTADALSQHRGPLIITGDFNSWSRERMQILAEIMQKLGAKEVVFSMDHRTTFLGKQVDHIYYRKLVPLDAVTEKVTTSDHNPMLVTFRLSNDVY